MKTFSNVFITSFTKLPKTINLKLLINNKNISKKLIFNILLKTLLIYIKKRINNTIKS